MLSFKCRNCGGEMSVNPDGSLVCEYCGSKEFFDDSELIRYRAFRKQMLDYLKGVHDEKAEGGHNEEMLWGSAEEVRFETAGGDPVNIRYLYSFEDDAGKVFLTRKNAIFIYGKDKKVYAEKVLWSIGELSFPPADMKGLAECFPDLIGKYDLSDGGVMLVFSRPENLFPLSMFGSLTPEHAAWVVSRLENICCVLKYSELVHGGISEHSVWINPFIHHAVLMGHWHSAVKSGIARVKDGEDADLICLRKTAERILGIHKNEAPQAMLEFLKDKPASDAYLDFEKWDEVIDKGFGGRRFAKGLTIDRIR